ncbi:TPA: hypothetical protein DCE37_12270 [Candidatus Latescibacteria bacterium]|nr:hypothetical protein [Candidatus Latescibacterota bacterium]
MGQEFGDFLKSDEVRLLSGDDRGDGLRACGEVRCLDGGSKCGYFCREAERVVETREGGLYVAADVDVPGHDGDGWAVSVPVGGSLSPQEARRRTART